MSPSPSASPPSLANPPARPVPASPPVSAPAVAPPGEFGLMVLLAVVYFTVALDFVIMMPLGPQLMRVFRIDMGQFNAAVSAYALAAGISGLLASSVLDRFDRKAALLFLYGGFAVGTLCCALAPTYELLVAARAAAGLCGGVVGGVLLAIVADTVPEHRRGAAIGLVMSTFPVAQILGVPMGLYLATQIGWHQPFLFLAVGSAGIWVAAWRLLPALRGHLHTGRGPRETSWQRLRAVFANVNHLKALGLTALITLAGFMVVTDLATYLVYNAGIGERQLPWIYLAGGVCMLCSMNAVGRLADRLGKLRVYLVMIVFAMVITLAITHLPPVGVGGAALCMGLFTIGMSGRYVPATAMITSSVDPAHRGGFMSVNSAVSQLFSALAASAAGLVVHGNHTQPLTGFGTVGWISVAFSLATIPLARQIRRATTAVPPTAQAGVVAPVH